MFAGKAGCFLYLLSLVLTRGAQRVREDMDDLETTCKSTYQKDIYIYINSCTHIISCS